MGCILLFLTLFSPRFVLFLFWAFDHTRWNAVFGQMILLPLLGFFFLPFTTLVYLFAYNPVSQSISAFGWIWLILALFVDLAAYGSNAYRRRQVTSSTTTTTNVIDSEE